MKRANKKVITNALVLAFGYYHNVQVYTLEKNKNVEYNNKFWLAILDSSVFWYYLKQTGEVLRGGYFRLKTKYIEPFPLPKLKNIEGQILFIEKVNLMLSKTEKIQLIDNKFQTYLQQKFQLEKLSKKTTKLARIRFL